MSQSNLSLKEEQDAAKRFKMPFGPHKGRELYDIAASGDVLYLDGLVDWKGLYPETKAAIKTFLSIDWVSRMVDEQIGD